MKFEPRKLDLPFYPGDSLFWIDEDTLKVKEEKGGIDKVVITRNSIKIQERGSSFPEDPESDGYTFLSKEAAEDAAKKMREQYPIRNYAGALASVTWLSPRKYLPQDGQRVLVTTAGGDVQECTFMAHYEPDDMSDVFIRYHRIPRRVPVVSWMALPDPDSYK